MSSAVCPACATFGNPCPFHSFAPAQPPPVPDRPAAGPWIAVTPETMPEPGRLVMVHNGIEGPAVALLDPEGDWISDDGCEHSYHFVTHYAEIRRPE